MELWLRPLTLKGPAAPATQAQAASQPRCRLPAPYGAQALRCQVWAWSWWGGEANSHPVRGLSLPWSLPLSEPEFPYLCKGDCTPSEGTCRRLGGSGEHFLHCPDFIPVCDDCMRFVSSESHLLYYVLKTSYFFSLKKKLYVIASREQVSLARHRE